VCVYVCVLVPCLPVSNFEQHGQLSKHFALAFNIGGHP